MKTNEAIGSTKAVGGGHTFKSLFLSLDVYM